MGQKLPVTDEVAVARLLAEIKRIRDARRKLKNMIKNNARAPDNSTRGSGLFFIEKFSTHRLFSAAELFPYLAAPVSADWRGELMRV